MATIEERLSTIGKLHIESDTDMIKELENAVARGMSDDERYEQMISFTMAMLPKGCTLTRSEVREILAKNKWA